MPASFTDTARLVELIAGTAGDVHFRVRPVLREVTSHRLLAGHGLVLDDAADAAGDRGSNAAPLLWDLVRPDRPEPLRPEAAPATTATAAAEVVDRIEAL